jgi:long-chain acyl-CoA synthetase
MDSLGGFLEGYANERFLITLTVAVVTWLVLSMLRGSKPPSSGFSVVLPGEEKVHRAPESPDELVALIEGLPHVRTSHDNFKQARETYPHNNCLGWRPVLSNGQEGVGPYEWMTYDEAYEAAKEFGDGLMAEQLIPKHDGMRPLALFSKNRREWVLSEQGLFMHGGVTVPIYDTLGEDTISYILEQTGAAAVVCTVTELARVVAAKPSCPKLKAAILMDLNGDAEPAPSTMADAADKGVKVYKWSEVRAMGASKPKASSPPGPDDVATLCYTSGTTGMPKGVLLSHANLIAAYGGAQVRGVKPVSTDFYLSYLPLAHVMERCCQLGLIAGGASIGFYQGDTLKIAADLVALRPTLFVSVPRLLNRVHDKVIAGASASPVKKFLFTTALASKKARLLATGSSKHAFWDALVFKKVTKKMGLDRCRMVITGSAPIAAHVMDFLRAVIGADVVEGYGQSETAASGTLSSYKDVSTGHVGGPWPCCEVKLVNVTEMGYLSTDTEHEVDGAIIPCHGRGEICFRGPNVFKGYYKMPDKTKETIDEDGWCHTGDIGIWLTSGQLKIVDRKKNIFKLAQGEYVAAEKIENVYGSCEYVAQSFVYGDSLKHFLVAVVVPDFEVLARWAKDNGKSTDPETLVNDADVRSLILDAMTKTGRGANLKGFELAKAIHLTHEPFSVDNDLLTPTFKIKRHEAKKYFKATLNKLYEE